MSQTEWTVTDVVASAEELVNQSLAIRGFLYGPVDSPQPVLYLMPSGTRMIHDCCLVIRDAEVLAALLANVPSWVGGEALFQDEAEVTGVLGRSDPAMRVELYRISSLVLLRDGERLKAI